MVEAIDRLVALIKSIGAWFLPFTILDQYERGLILRRGLWVRDLEPGWCWMWPLGWERTLTASIAWDTSSLEPQSLTTSDNVDVSLRVVIGHRVHNARTYLLEVTDQQQVLTDVAYGAVARHVRSSTWETLIDAEKTADLLKEIRRGAFKYGVEVRTAEFRDLAKAPVFRVIQ